jgi:hypothetical protein
MRKIIPLVVICSILVLPGRAQSFQESLIGFSKAFSAMNNFKLKMSLQLYAGEKDQQPVSKIDANMLKDLDRFDIKWMSNELLVNDQSLLSIDYSSKEAVLSEHKRPEKLKQFNPEQARNALDSALKYTDTVIVSSTQTGLRYTIYCPNYFAKVIQADFNKESKLLERIVYFLNEDGESDYQKIVVAYQYALGEANLQKPEYDINSLVRKEGKSYSLTGSLKGYTLHIQ